MVVLKWLGYDQAFRQQAAATKLVDWSTVKIQPYNFHADGACVHSGSGGSLSELPEPSGLELAPPGSFASCGRGAAVWHSLLRVGLPIAAALVRVLTMRWNAQVV